MKTGKVPFWRKNIGLKLLALVFSLFLWFFVVGEEKAEVSLNIPLEIIHMPSEMVISNEFPGSIEVRVYGPRSLVRELANRPMSHEIDLSGASAGKMGLKFTPESMRVPRGVQVTRIHPAQVTLVLEPLARREVAVKPVLQGSPDGDYELTGVSVDPSSVTVSGAAKELSKVGTIQTQPIDISGLTGSTEVPAYVSLDKLHLKIAGDPRVKVRLQIQEKKTQKKLMVPIAVVGGVSYKIYPESIHVLVKGPVSMLRNGPKGNEIRAVVNLEGLQPGGYTKRPSILAAPGLEAAVVEPGYVKITITK